MARVTPATPAAAHKEETAEAVNDRSLLPEFMAAKNCTLAEVLAVCDNLLAEIARVFFQRGVIVTPVADFRRALDRRINRPAAERREYAWALMHEMRRFAFAYDPPRCGANPNAAPKRFRSEWGKDFD